MLCTAASWCCSWYRWALRCVDWESHRVAADMHMLLLPQGLNPGKAIAKIKQSLHKGSPV